MDINTLRGLSTVFVMIAFLGVCWWAFAPSRKQRFDDAANLPFADETEQEKQQNREPQSDSSTGDNKTGETRRD